MKLMKTLLFTTLITFASVSFASNSLTVGVGSDNIVRGESITEDSMSVNLGLRFDDLLFSGAYLRGDTSTIQLTPVTDNVRFRSDVGVGYVFDMTRLGGLSADFSVNRVLNSVLHEEDYSEVRFFVTTDWNLFNFLDFYANANYTLNGLNDTYTGVGVVARDFFVEGLNLRTSVNFYRFDEADDFGVDSWNRNNWEFGADYNVWRNVSVTALYSSGRVGLARTTINNEWVVGLRATF